MIHVYKLSKSFVEDQANATLLDFERAMASPLAPPIDVDIVGEFLYQLHWDWDEIIEETFPKNGFGDIHPDPKKKHIILAGLYPYERRVVLNERHRDIFDKKLGLERFTKGHEIGHWVLHIDKSTLNHPQLFADENNQECIICRDGDDTWIERQANWYSAALLMPRSLLFRIAQEYDLLNWTSLYDMANHFGVTITALCIRLKQCNLSYIDENGHIYKSEAEYVGQLVF